MKFSKFLRNEQPDFKGRFLEDIWNFNDDQIEYNHDFIQLIFPLNKPSQAVANNLFLKTKEEINSLREDELVKRNILKSKNWFMKFLINNMKWRSYSDHNQLRITRIIECLRLLVSDHKADEFYQDIIKILGSKNKVNPKTLSFWKNA